MFLSKVYLNIFFVKIEIKINMIQLQEEKLIKYNIDYVGIMIIKLHSYIEQKLNK